MWRVLLYCWAAVRGSFLPAFLNEYSVSPEQSKRRGPVAPYSSGATGPRRFGCSGLTPYSLNKAGKTLPRTAAQQYNKTRHIGAGSRKAGDLVFFHSGSNVYHVGIYAGKGKIWHAPKTGDVVRLQKIWTKSVWYGRVK